MFQLQIQYNSTEPWENTVYKPMPYDKALQLLNEYRRQWGHVHTYKLVPTGASK